MSKPSKMDRRVLGDAAAERFASIADNVRERGDGCLESVEALEESHRALAAQLEAFVELANGWFTGGMPEDWRGRCVCANAVLDAAKKI